MIPASRVQFLGPYRLGQRLGVGGMAEVFAAESDQFGRVALKRILPGLARDKAFVDMFWDEARITSRLDHPNVTKVLDYGRAEDELYMALEYIDGPTLARVLRKAAKSKDTFDVPVLVALMVELLDALHYVHSLRDEMAAPLGIVHRDISPGNVMLTAEGHVKLGDFGIVRSEAVMRRTQPGELKGKIGYMSPEQALGGAVHHTSDLFSVGIIMAEFLTLRPLFLGKTEMQTLSRTATVDLSTWHRHNGSVPLALRRVVEKSLQLEPSCRHRSAGEMRSELLAVARSAGWELRGDAIVTELRSLELLPEESQGSGERRVARGPVPGSGSAEAVRESEELPTMVQSLGAPRRPQGKPRWKVGFTQATLPMQLFSAFRRTWDGVIELSAGGELLSIEFFRGRILAAHDSTGVSPLGRMLIEGSLVTPSQLATAIGESRRVDLRLGEYLVQAGRLRESVLARLLREQSQVRIARWLSQTSGELAIFTGESSHSGDAEAEAGAESDLVMALRRGFTNELLELQLRSVQGCAILPVDRSSTIPLGLTEPELRALRTTMSGGSYEGQLVRTVLDGVVAERIARPGEAMFALVVALASGFVQAPGFGR